MKPPSHGDRHSRAAAKRIAKHAPSLREDVFGIIEQWGEIAAFEIERELGLAGNTVRPRLVELERVNRIEKHGTSQTPAGRTCHLYRVAPKPTVLLQTRAFDAPELVPHG